MKSSALLLAFAAFATALPASAQTAPASGCALEQSCSVTPVATKPDTAKSPADAALIAQARATYPLKTCLVSDEPLGSMGEPLGYVHRTAGQPDRVVFFCCGGCTDDFKAEPAKFLAKLDAAAKAKK